MANSFGVLPAMPLGDGSAKELFYKCYYNVITKLLIMAAGRWTDDFNESADSAVRHPFERHGAATAATGTFAEWMDQPPSFTLPRTECRRKPISS